MLPTRKDTHDVKKDTSNPSVTDTVVKFYGSVEDGLLRFAVILAKKDGKYVFCKHKDRNTWEIPGGHREAGETILDTAKRELYEETGALDFSIEPICVYSVTAPDHFDGQESFGMFFYAEIKSFETELHNEIEKIKITVVLPEHWTYPLIQPKLLEYSSQYAMQHATHTAMEKGF